MQSIYSGYVPLLVAEYVNICNNQSNQIELRFQLASMTSKIFQPPYALSGGVV